MIDVGFWEIAMIGVLALIILGPERLPGVAQTAGRWVGNARRMMNELKADMKTEIEQSDLKDVGEQLRQAKNSFESQINTVQKDAKDALDKTSSVDKAIADALNKPLTSATKQPSSTTKKKLTKKKITKKLAAKKTVAKKTASKATTKKKVAAKSKTRAKKSNNKSSSTPSI